MGHGEEPRVRQRGCRRGGGVAIRQDGVGKSVGTRSHNACGERKPLKGFIQESDMIRFSL